MGLFTKIRNHITDNYSSHKRFRDGRGYNHVFRDGRYQLEHRYKMEQKLKRSLRSDEVVHHKNGKKWKNNISNLKMMSKWEHDELHGFHKYGYPKRK